MVPGAIGWPDSDPPSVLDVQQILDKESFTLEELLDEDDLIQECKSMNARLINL